MKLPFSTLYLAAALVAGVAAIALASPLPQGSAAAEGRPAPEFRNIDNWLNSPPLTMEQLRGKVVLVDFWTYTCINCLNHLPYVKDWHARYKDKGLVVVGVHTPEFAFEKSAANVRQAIERLQIEHAVAQDNAYGTWRSFDNHYWPAVYLIDKQGRIAYSHYGEGRYGETQKKIEELLAQPAAAGS